MEQTKTTDNQKECGLVSRYESDKAIMHLNWANRRMLIALITVCLTFIITIIVFVSGYTHREKNWLDTLKNMNKTPAVTEVSDGQKTD
jgi:hypothetical protein